MDRIECEAMGRKPKDALRNSLKASLHALTAINEHGRPIAMLGVVSAGLMSGRGIPWLLGTNEVFRHGRDLMVAGRCTISWWLEIFPVLENLVASDNGKAIRLLRKWGAEVGGPSQTHRGVEFLTFHFERDAIQGQRTAA